MPFRSRDSSINSRKDDMEDQDGQDVAPPVTDLPESANKDLMLNHPLGKIVLNIAATSNEIARKSKHYGNILNLNNICDQFADSMQLESKRFSQHVDENSKKLSAMQPDIEKALLNKELDFVHLNQSITPPNFASEDTGKLQEASKVFPVKNKFNGTNRSILEFLQDINFCQETCKLSEKEFLEMLLRCTTQKCYNILVQYMAIGFSTSDIYLSLLLLFDTRSTPTDCRKQLAHLTAHKSMNIIELQNKIMYLAGRTASDLPPGAARQSVYNLEACRALMSALPSQSSHLVTSKYNILTARLTTAPTFVQLLKILAPHQDLINQDIQNNGTVTHNSKHYTKNPANYVGRKGHIFTMDIQNQGESINTAGSAVHDNKIQKRYGANRPPMGKKPQAFQRYNKGYKMNNAPRFDRDRGNTIKQGCSLCGGTNHTAASICYKMRTDSNKIIEVVPTYTPCDVCEKVLGKKLYHPAKFCISRPTYPKATRGREDKQGRRQ